MCLGRACLEVGDEWHCLLDCVKHEEERESLYEKLGPKFRLERKVENMRILIAPSVEYGIHVSNFLKRVWAKEKEEGERRRD